MPVLSPHRTSASALNGSYRSTFSAPSIDRPFYGSSSYSPRITTYSERYTSRSYTDTDGRRIFSRSGSITEDGVTTRFREDSREGSVRRDSVSKDSGISSIRENTILDSRRDSSDYPRRDSSLTRNDSRLTASNVFDSVAELRNKYSPANYVPAIFRKNENISRSKSINDIGLPPIEAKSNKKKVTESLNHNNSTSVLNSNHTNFDNMTIDDDDNGNRASVADLRKRFDDSPPKSSKPPPIQLDGPSVKIAENRFKKLDNTDSTQKIVNAKVTKSGTTRKSSLKLNGEPSNVEKLSTDIKSSLETNHETKELNGIDSKLLEDSPSQNSRSTSRVNNFASYIPSKDYEKEEILVNGCLEVVENGLDYKELKTSCNNDITSSPKLNRSTISPTNSGSTTTASTGTNSSNSIAINTSSVTPTAAALSRRSNDRDSLAHHTHRLLHREYSDEDLADGVGGGGGGRNYQAGRVKIQGLNGLKNIGNTCFMNSVIQCLSNTRPLLEYVKKDGYMKDVNTSISSMKGALIKAFAEVIKELWSEDSSDRVVNTVSLKSQIQRFAPRFIGYAQQDAQEFLRYFLEGLHEDVNRVTEKPKPILTEIDEKLSDSEKAKESWQRYLRMDNSKIVDLFVGQLKSTLKCTHCNHCSVTFDPFWDLSLPMPQRTGQLRLSQCLDSFTREETLDGDEKPTCSKCKERRKCTKSFTIQKFPKILVIHLKRFSPMERFRGKLNVTVDFPLEGLDMSNYAADSVSSPCRYNLYAISNHSGTTYSGHYTAYCRHPYTQSWHEYNDSRVSSISPKSIVSGEAYVLFYEQEGQKSHL